MTYSTIDDIEEKAGAIQTEFTVTLNSGAQIRARYVNDAAELMALQKKTREAADILNSVPPPGMEDFLPTSPILLGAAIMLNEIVIEPEIPLPKALEWSKYRGPLFIELVTKIVNHVQQRSMGAEMEAIVEAKNA